MSAEKVNFDTYNKLMVKELKENGIELPNGLDEYYQFQDFLVNGFVMFLIQYLQIICDL